MEREGIIDIDKYTEIRHYLHKNPEIAFKEFETAQYIQGIIETFKNSDKATITKYTDTGFCVDVHGNKNNSEGNIKNDSRPKFIALRADIDCLAIKENTGLGYSSVNEGYMHACGHDGHITILLATLEKILININNIPQGFGIRFLFQPAEEIVQGAKEMIKAGALYNIEEIYGLHNSTKIPLGTLGCIRGPTMSRSDIFKIKIEGKGGHSSTPYLSKNSINAGVKVISFLNKIVSNEISSKDIAVISVGNIHSNNKGSCQVISSNSEITGTIRTFNDTVAEGIINRAKSICERVATLSGSSITFQTDNSIPATDNWQDQADLVINIIKKRFKLNSLFLPSLGSEDFACYLKLIPGCFFFLGIEDEKHKSYIHTDTYDFNDKCIEIGVEMFVRIIENRSGAIILK